MLDQSTILRLTKLAINAPADGMVRFVEIPLVSTARICHWPATDLKLEQVRVQAEAMGTLFRRRFMNGEWQRTEEISGSIEFGG